MRPESVYEELTFDAFYPTEAEYEAERKEALLDEAQELLAKLFKLSELRDSEAEWAYTEGDSALAISLTKEADTYAHSAHIIEALMGEVH